MTFTVSQSRVALAHANVVRIDNAMWLRDLRALDRRDGLARVADLLETPELDSLMISAIAIARLLRGVRLLGPASVAPLLRRAGIVTGDRKLKLLTERQRRELAAALREMVR